MDKRLPGLDFIRFYAALTVLVQHTLGNVYSDMTQHPVGLALSRLLLNGPNAVQVFFVLSGFLITYLMLAEIERDGKLNIKAFYLRRLLRIHPLYFTIVLIAFVVMPLVFPDSRWLPNPATLPGVLLFLPNVVFATQLHRIPVHLWSIGVEEQFYALYPLLIRLFQRHCWFAIVALFLLRWAILFVIFGSGNPDLIPVAFWTRFDALAFGAMAGYLAYRQSPALKLLYHPLTQWLALLYVAFTVWQYHDGIGVVYDLLRASAFSIYILNVATNPRAILRIDTRWTEPLGNLSYSLYMWHPLIIFGIGEALPLGILFEPVLFVSAIGLSFAASVLSYRYLETPFLRLRHRKAKPAQLAQSVV